MPVVAVGAIAGVVAALMALLIIYGLIALGKIVAHLFPSSVGIGPFSFSPRGLVLDAVGSLEAAAVYIVGDIIRPVINFILSPVFAILNWVNHVGDAIADVATFSSWVTFTAIPRAIANAVHYAQVEFQLAETYAATLAGTAIKRAEDYTDVAYASAIGYIKARISDAENIAAAALATADANLVRDINNVIDLVHSDVSALSSLLDADIAGVSKFAHNVLDELHAAESTLSSYAASEAAKALDAAEAFATTAVANAIHAVDIDGVKELETIWETAIPDVRVALGVIATDLPDIGAALRELEGVNIGDLAGALAVSGVVAKVLTRYLSECGIPNCRNLSHFGRILQDLLHAAEGAAFLEFIIGLVHDPRGGARTVESLFGPVLDGAVTSIRETVGV